MPSTTDYKLLSAQLESLFEGETNLVANLSNASAAINDALDNVNWAGFYLMDQNADGAPELVLGPFQGHAACIRIAVGRGVCGTAVARDEAQLVVDVHQFAGHIACDSASNSEVVIPLHAGGMVVGVLDIDSPSVARFSEDDLAGLTLCASKIEAMWQAALEA